MSQKLRYMVVIEKGETTFGAVRSGAIRQMRGLLKTDQPAPTDEQVTAMLEERQMEKYLS